MSMDRIRILGGRSLNTEGAQRDGRGLPGKVFLAVRFHRSVYRT